MTEKEEKKEAIKAFSHNIRKDFVSTRNICKWFVLDTEEHKIIDVAMDILYKHIKEVHTLRKLKDLKNVIKVDCVLEDYRRNRE